MIALPGRFRTLTGWPKPDAPKRRYLLVHRGAGAVFVPQLTSMEMYFYGSHEPAHSVTQD